MADEVIEMINKSKMEAAHAWWTGSNTTDQTRARRIIAKLRDDSDALGMTVDRRFERFFPEWQLPSLYAFLRSAKEEERAEVQWLICQLHDVQREQECKAVPTRVEVAVCGLRVGTPDFRSIVEVNY